MTERKLLVLYTRMSGYFMGCLNKLSAEFPVRILLISQKQSSDAPFNFKMNENVTHFYYEDLQQDYMLKIKEFAPDFIYCSGWANKNYNEISKFYRKKNIPVIVGIDNPWKGTLKQQVLVLLSRFMVRSRFSHIWIPGHSQFVYAVKLGFPRSKILKGLYCCEEKYGQVKAAIRSKTILFVGRLVEFKRPLWVAQAFNEIVGEGGFEGWRLKIIGNGQLKDEIRGMGNPNVEIQDFMSPDELVDQFSSASLLCLPSRDEHWGVVVHEALTAGLPVIASDSTGAGDDLIIHGYNGFIFDSTSFQDFKQTLREYMLLSDSRKDQMQCAALELSKRVTQQQWCYSLLSTLN